MTFGLLSGLIRGVGPGVIRLPPFGRHARSRGTQPCCLGSITLDASLAWLEGRRNIHSTRAQPSGQGLQLGLGLTGCGENLAVGDTRFERGNLRPWARAKPVWPLDSVMYATLEMVHMLQ